MYTTTRTVIRVSSGNPKDDIGFRRLAAASVEKAIEDAAGDELQMAYSATRWLAGDTWDGLTFERCCLIIGIAPESLRRRLRLRHGEIRVRLEQYDKVRVMSIQKPRHAL